MNPSVSGLFFSLFCVLVQTLITPLSIAQSDSPCETAMAGAPQKATDAPVHILFSGDTHGNLVGLLRSAIALQKAKRISFAYIFQVGDFGYYPTGEANDKSSRKPQKELLARGVQDYLRDPEPFTKYFDQTKRDEFSSIRAPIFFIRGNHEDHEALNQLSKSALQPIDVNGRRQIFYVPDNTVFSLQFSPTRELRIAAYGGVAADSRPSAYARDQGIAFNNNHLNHLLSYANSVDILLTHQGPEGVVKGSGEITSLIELLQPKWHLHGHSHAVLASDFLATPTQSFGLARISDELNPQSLDHLRAIRFLPSGQFDYLK